jgi:hypothetical protein
MGPFKFKRDYDYRHSFIITLISVISIISIISIIDYISFYILALLIMTHFKDNYKSFE